MTTHRVGGRHFLQCRCGCPHLETITRRRLGPTTEGLYARCCEGHRVRLTLHNSPPIRRVAA